MANTRLRSVFYCLVSLLPGLSNATPSPAPTTSAATFPATFFTTYCTSCHGDQVQQSGLSLSHITDKLVDSDKFNTKTLNPEKLETWRMIDHRLRYFDMPPKHAKQPGLAERNRVLQWIRKGLIETQKPDANIAHNPRLQLPEFGNYVDHDALFNAPAGPVIPGPARLWRVRPAMYQAQLAGIRAGAASPPSSSSLSPSSSSSSSPPPSQPDPLAFSQPFAMRGKPEIKDYASLYFVDEPTTDLLLRNARLIVDEQARQPRYGAVFEALQAEKTPNQQARSQAIASQFMFALRRTPSAEENQRFLALWQKNLTTSGHPVGTQATLMTVLLQAEALFRFELGADNNKSDIIDPDAPLPDTEDPDTLGHIRLSHSEIAQSINYALRNTFDQTLWLAGKQQTLTEPEQITKQLNRLLSAPIADNPRLLQFFREYFHYPRATEVFKDAPTQGRYDPQQLINDLDALIGFILDEDKAVLKRLLTTNLAFVNWKVNAQGIPVPARREAGVENIYGLPIDWKWTAQQPVTLPADQRAGVLTHPAWLTTWSGNFDNDPIRRGKWIRTHLLGGSVPDVPIGVDARIPEDKQLTLRERLSKATEKPECWRCHQRMNPLGLPFEQYNHYGLFRRNEQSRPVDTRGRIDRTGDPQLDDIMVNNPVQMMQKLASSERVEQVFVRHAFRFFLGRNETLGDAATLQNAWQAYRNGNGSFKALVRSLLTSESFLYRRL